MKRADLIRILEANGYYLKRNGANHDIYWHPDLKLTIPIQRHREIPDAVAQAILKQAGIKNQ